jgi:uncharacterized OB-fold protein
MAPIRDDESRRDRSLILEPFDRPIPEVSSRDAHFWRAGSEGQLSIARCDVCSRLAHPTPVICPNCYSRGLTPEHMSGLGTVYSFTVNHYMWEPSLPPPYIVVSVELEEQEGLRLVTNLVGSHGSDVLIGMPVEACFARHGEWYVPLFRPRADGGSTESAGGIGQ